MKPESEKTTLGQLYPEIAAEWDYEKNEGTPDDYGAYSPKIVHWICSQGHSYTAAIGKRTRRGDACNICSGNKIVEGINDLGTLRPELMVEWDFDKNFWIFPTQVTVMSNKKVWWKCLHCGHSWEAAISNRTRGSGCPKCRYKRSVKTRAGKRTQFTTSFGKIHPELLAEWDYDKNKDHVDPMKISPGSGKKVWWKCSKCGNEWEATINNRSRGTGCWRCSHYAEKRRKTSR